MTDFLILKSLIFKEMKKNNQTLFFTKIILWAVLCNRDMFWILLFSLEKSTKIRFFPRFFAIHFLEIHLRQSPKIKSHKEVTN